MKYLIVIAIALLGCRVMALPESQYQTCVESVTSWHVARVANIQRLAVPDEIKAEMIAFSVQENNRMLNEICAPGPAIAQQ